MTTNLYGTERLEIAEKLKQKLTKDSILQKGEYNLPPGSDKWESITSGDFRVGIVISLIKILL